jgi:hypothetical protein
MKIIAIAVAAAVLAAPVQASHEAEMHIYVLQEGPIVTEAMPHELCELFAGLINVQTEDPRYSARCHQLVHAPVLPKKAGL